MVGGLAPRAYSSDTPRPSLPTMASRHPSPAPLGTRGLTQQNMNVLLYKAVTISLARLPAPPPSPGRPGRAV